MKRRASFRLDRAFTLIELLVVIVIVGVLASLLLGVLASVRENGNSAQCVSNLRQISSALMLYTQDHANTLPQRYYGYDPQGNPVGYPEIILSYVDPGSTPKSSSVAKKLFTCPSQTNANYPTEPGYGMNWYYDNTNLGVVAESAQTILLTDSKGSSGHGSRRADRDNRDGDIGKLDDKRHRGKANYLFFDGHVAYLAYADTRKALSSSTETPPLDSWGKDYQNRGLTVPTTY